MKLKIPKNRCKILVLFIVYFYLFSGLLMDMLGVPRLILYLGDIVNAFAFILVFFSVGKEKTRGINRYIVTIAIFVFVNMY